MPILQGVLVAGAGPSLGSLTLSALPPYGNKSLGQLCATISGQSAGTVISLLVGETGQFYLSPDQTQLLAGPAYSPSISIIRLRESARGYLNSPLLSTFDSNGLQGVSVPKIGGVGALPAFRAAVNGVKAGTRRGRILCLGSSITQGAYAASQAYGSNDTPPDLILKAWPAQMATGVFAAAGIPTNLDCWFGDGNIYQYGASNFSGYNPKLTAVSGVSTSTSGQLGGNSFYRNTGGVVDFAPAAQVTNYEVYAQVISGGSALQLYIDAASYSGQITPTGTTNSIVKIAVPPTAKLTSHLGIFVATTNQYVTINGVVAYDTNTKSVDIINCGWNGGVASQILGNSNPDSPLKTIATLSPDLVILEIGVNDSLQGLNLSSYESTLRAAVATIKATGSDLHIVISPPFQNGGANSQPSAAQRATYDLVTKRVAYDNNLTITDLVSYYGTWDAMVAAGLSHDTVHPRQAGYLSMANKIGSDIIATLQ